MKILNLLALILFSALLFSSCEKVDELPSYDFGTAPALTASSNIAAPQLSDSANLVVTFKWTNPKYATDSSTVRYTFQIDSAGKNFTDPYYSKEVVGQNEISLRGDAITKLIVDRGLAYNTQYDLDIRVVSSYANNNEKLISNVIRVKMSAYVTPPKVTLPFTNRLFIVGSATQGGWNNPVPAPMQEFARIDSVTYVGVFNMNANEEFLLLPDNGSWSNKYSVTNNLLSGISAGGDFGYNLPQNFKGPLTTGWHKITMDFQRGKFTIEAYNGAEIPSDLFIVGNATPGGWNNPVPEPSQKFTRLNSVQFVLNSLPINQGGEYLLLPVNGSWSNKYSVQSTGTSSPVNGFFGYNRPGNFPGPTVTGNYKMEVNFGVQEKDASGMNLANTAFYKNTKL